MSNEGPPPLEDCSHMFNNDAKCDVKKKGKDRKKGKNQGNCGFKKGFLICKQNKKNKKQNIKKQKLEITKKNMLEIDEAKQKLNDTRGLIVLYIYVY